jgi:hypothetical protein
MKLRSLRPRAFAAAVAALVAASGLSADTSFAHSPVYVDDSGKLNPGSVSHFVDSTTGTARYIVRFKEEPVAVHFAASASADRSNSTSVFRTGKNGSTHLDVTNSTVQAYAAQLSSLQQQRLADISTAIGYEPVKPKRYQMMHALNAVVLSFNASDVQKVLKVDGVVAVTRDRPHPLSTDIGPGFIGASSVWFGTPAGQDSFFASGFDDNGDYRGDGIVIGDIDTGYNSMSPSFQATDASGYTIQNPLGSGNFLSESQCGMPNISLAGCNDKVIGVYDEIDLTNSDPNFDGTSYSVEDVQGHGSHTASTAGGNGRSATASGYTASVSGVAPHANLVIYYACSPDVTIQCSDAATSSSVDQAIQDGIVDALNFSISGGTDPWNDPTSLAFLAAADAGIFVAAAAGNTGTGVPVPLPGTANHSEPWVTTVAASTHTGGAVANQLSATSPGTPPANARNLNMQEGGGDNYTGGFKAAVPATTSIIISPNFDASDTTGTDGCAAYPANKFQGAIALISRGTCAFETQAVNAQTAGAVAIVISDNLAEAIFSPYVGASPIHVPIWLLGQADGLNLQAFIAANPTATAGIPYFGIRLTQHADELASFSLLGPASIDVIKPDVQAPGVNILASIANDGTADGPNLVALYNGTSMGAPHTSGSGALLMGLHTDWTAQETRSAMMMTALEQGLTKPDGTTPSDYFDRGSGRLQDFPASRSGLVLNETGLNFANADPANGGNPSTLNIASMQSASCVTTDQSGPTTTCSFTRKFRSTQNAAVTYTSAVTGVSATVTPASLTVPAHANAQPMTVTVDASSYNADNVFHFGELILTPSDTTLPTLHLPIAIKVPPPVISASPQPLETNFATGSAVLTVSNIGGAPLIVSNTDDATVTSTRFVVIDQVSQGDFAFYSDFFTDLGGGYYAADDFQAFGSASTNLSKLSFPGFTTGSTPLSGFAGANIHFEIYTDVAGAPSGNPETVAPSYIYSFVAVIGTTPGLDVTGDTISLDLTAAGAPATALSAGRYWMVVWPEIAYGDGRWAWFESVNTFNSNAHKIDPDNLSGGGVTTWVDNTASGGFPGMAMHIEAKVACGAGWLSATPSTLTIAAGDSAQLTVFGPVPDTAYLCLDSNDPANPVLAVQVIGSGF